uniref:ATPase8 protein n=1 Tax=Valvata hokkaidoensis TaxID=96458 RepID=A0A7R7YC56_9GAST|nr:ATPase8 [Valvata hokkaidoensis]
MPHLSPSMWAVSLFLIFIFLLIIMSTIFMSTSLKVEVPSLSTKSTKNMFNFMK